MVILFVFFFIHLLDSRSVTTFARGEASVGKSIGDINVLVGAGNIADCSTSDSDITANILNDTPGTIFTTGNNVLGRAALIDYIKCFGQTWGKYIDRIRPSLGSSDYSTANASGYFSYFGDSAGPAGKGYYSYNLASWHIVVLNSNCDQVGGCDENSVQSKWLKSDLSQNKAFCTLAYWSAPLFNSAKAGDSLAVKPFWRILYAAHADVVINGGENGYERFALQDVSGKKDNKNGIREFIVGTGGGGYALAGRISKNSEIRNYDTFGLLKLSLSDKSYNWQFLSESNSKFKDSGLGVCQ